MVQKENNGKSKTKLLTLLAKEIKNAWNKQDIPTQRLNSFIPKLKRFLNKQSINKFILLINSIENIVLDVESNSLFSIIPSNPKWKSLEDKLYFEAQLNRVGYCTTSKASYL